MRLIIHADDLGKSEAVNEAIFGLMSAGKITSASILANGPAFDSAIRGTRHFPRCSFGAHLNLSEFEPLNSSLELRPLLVNGSFRSTPQLHRVSASLRKAIVTEWSSQIHRLRDAGLDVTHIDSHHHVHTRFPLLSALERVCREHTIRRVRLRHTFSLKPRSWRIDHRFYNALLRRKFTCADEFGPFAAFATVAPRLHPSSTIELMVHPGHPSYANETEELARSMNGDFRALYQCVSHRELNCRA